MLEVSGFSVDEVVLVTDPTAIRALNAPYAGGTGNSSAFVVTINVTRKSLFMLRLVVLPLALIVMLSWCVF